ncbi:SDR family NAD(P)-dependent oxidoreductase [Aureimonas jatrophae]|uniref:NAD(P)-dependent dehydrogenase, short-chain alcohol dehydrogenase family n=1 Tax=Aureimonas jatrophae TaxID=1166073 RepID=A0A1H0MND7_9HYPH|nr:glucose 1-dehydrogenase [Aureimonas jatrophae]MBB3953088.1 NAD(P)-dependent dehydrogenase (short-subunit alcohol dehydrogenase family) [Aureimonas jatrophae]SDO76071.1 NAD(P)-dependent dehydrogenase, short-chain alcohol dehydrogenase family [Aureimonas jatrophae]SDO81963.1 NAD(P)-dependent dehydrogenase, short-chain alcohol dehydrogenase family [Aureimonas jatrophae]
MGKLDRKIAIVTGGSSGIGLAIAERFIAEGATVYITGRRQAELEAAGTQLGEKAKVVQGDVADLNSLDRLFETVRQAEGRLDVLVANAGVIASSPIETASEEHFDRMFDINVKGTYFTLQKALPLMRDGGSIILVSSCLSAKGMAGHSVYNATKAAVRSLVRTAAAELVARGIRVNTLSPGPVDTPIIEGQVGSLEAAAEFRRQAASHVPLGRIGRPEELAAAALFLASDESSFSTGTDLVVDGGMTQL